MGPGQITDDSEMAMCIMQGLTDPECAVDASKIPHTLNLDGMAHYFGKWSRQAFDIGYTTQKALRAITDINDKQHKDTVAVFKKVVDVNQTSQSNGCLMRLTPMIVWGKYLND